MKRVPDQGPRKAVHDAVANNPGVHLREIERMTGLPLGVVRYHLDRLEQDGLLFSKHDRHFRRFFSMAKLPPNIPTEMFEALRQGGTREILLHLLSNPGTAHGNMAEALGIPASTLSTRLSILMGKRLVRRERLDGRSLYFLVDEESVARVLMVYRSSFADLRVDRTISDYLGRT